MGNQMGRQETVSRMVPTILEVKIKEHITLHWGETSRCVGLLRGLKALGV